MQILETVKTKIKQLHTCDAAYILAHAAWSACDHRMLPQPSALEVSSRLDSGNKELVFQLQGITLHHDYDNDDQADMLQWLHDRDYSAYIAKQLNMTKNKLFGQG